MYLLSLLFFINFAWSRLLLIKVSDDFRGILRHRRTVPRDEGEHLGRSGGTDFSAAFAQVFAELVDGHGRGVADADEVLGQGFVLHAFSLQEGHEVAHQQQVLEFLNHFVLTINKFIKVVYRNEHLQRSVFR